MYETNSKLVKIGDIFVCIKGKYNDGHDFINEALQNGAKLIVSEKKLDKSIPHIKVKNTKTYLTKKVGKLNKKLSQIFTIIGITGTKGKSTTALITYQLLKQLNIKVGYIGTLGLYYLNNKELLENTTPDILTINKILNKFKEEGITHIVMEVSSHSLYEKRIKGLKFKTCAFTNLSQDHLDYHKDMKSYLKAKLKILKYLDGNIILNSDDIASTAFKKKTKNYITVGENANYKIINYSLYQTSTLISFEHNYDIYSVYIPYVGKYNIYNYLESFAILKDLDFDYGEIINASNNLVPIKGRNELIKSKNRFVVIDYAHSPESVKETILCYNELKKGKVITIIGCGGNRDKTKRPIMANIACAYSDYVIFTSDNPRDENPKDILKDMTNNLTYKNFEIIENRSKAIKKGIKLLKEKDYLLVLGKGHEDYQIIKNVKYPFDDKKEALRYLS